MNDKIKKLIFYGVLLFCISFLFILLGFLFKEKVFGAITDGVWNTRGTYLEPAKITGYDLLIKGNDKYINFNSISGSSGYGLRDNSGNVEFKNNGGSWTGIGTGGGSIDQLGQIGDVSTSTLDYGHLLMWNGTDTWQDTATSSLGISGSGTVTSVNMSVPTGLTIAGNPIVNSGTLALTLIDGYAIASTTRLYEHDTAYSWGNHVGLYDIYGQATSTLTSHTTTYNHANYDTAYGWGNHASAGYFPLTAWFATTTHALISSLPALTITESQISDLDHYTDADVSTYLTSGTGVDETAGALSFDCSDVEGTGINCVGEAITLDATGDWTGTIDGYQGADFLTLTSWFATTTHALISSLPSLSITVSQISNIAANYQPLEATLTDIADGTITENLVNTANPWADNEVADNITASNYLSLTTWFATTTHSLINSLPALATVGTLTGGATGAGFTVNLDASTLTCTNCIDISGNTNLTAGDHITLTDDDLDIDDDFLLNNGDTATGDYTFGTNVFVISDTNNKVGIASSSPYEELGIVGQIYIDGTSAATSTIEGNYEQCNADKTHCCYTVWGTASSTNICF